MLNSAFGGRPRTRWGVLALLSCVCGSALAADVVLKDGTVIHGDIESLRDGVYTVKTDSLGTVRVRKQEVRSIDEDEGAASRSGPEPSAPGPGTKDTELQSLQLSIVQDPKLLTMLLALQNDPDVTAVLADPQIMAKIAAGDYTALMNDPKIVALMNNEKVRAIIEEMQ
jgi:hypothetical protein